VKARRDELQRQAAERGDLILVNDIPLLFEVLDPTKFDVVILVDAPVAVRRTRLRSLRQLPNEDADRMIAAQMPSERKRDRSHFVIENAGTLQELAAAAKEVFVQLRRRAAPQAIAALGVGPLLLAEGDGKDSNLALAAIEALARDAGETARRVGGKAPTIMKALREAPPGIVVAVAPVAEAAQKAWHDAGKPGALFALGMPGPTLDLRPWGHARVTLNPLA
jgi:hypothetical protein